MHSLEWLALVLRPLLVFPNLLAVALLPPRLLGARVLDYERDAGAIPADDSHESEVRNARALSDALAMLQPGDELVVPNRTYHLMGGVVASGLESVTIRIDGALVFSKRIDQWPLSENGTVLECLTLQEIVNVTVTSSSRGLLEGQGGTWWGIPGIGYLERKENRPRLLRVIEAQQCLFERLLLKDSPKWTFHISGDNVEIRDIEISARRTNKDGHSLIDLSAFNTDGIDVSGSNFWVHDCTIWNQDDCIAVKDNSSNMLFERISASGLGLTIGSIGSSIVNNITFRNCHMHKTRKGIYIKFRYGKDGELGYIGDILYENIYMYEPEQVPIWIGPAQQADDREFWKANPCSLLWPEVPYTKCHVPPSTLENVTLRNITVHRPQGRPGFILGNATNPMRGIVFDGVKVIDSGHSLWGKDNYRCIHTHGTARGGTSPVPPCFHDETNSSVLVV